MTLSAVSVMFTPALAAPFTTLLGDYDVSVGSAAGARAAITASAKPTFIPRPSFWPSHASSPPPLRPNKDEVSPLLENRAYVAGGRVQNGDDRLEGRRVGGLADQADVAAVR